MKEIPFMLKAAITTVLALGLGAAAATGANAAAVPVTAMQGALAATDLVQSAQTVYGRPVVAPRGAAVVRRGPAVVGRPVVGRPVGVVGRPVGVYRGPGVYRGGPGFYRGPVFVRAYRPFYRRPWFGTVVGGVALGTILTVAAVGVAPASPPAPGLCWYWGDPSMTSGYWDYCTAPY
jgi:hypothetical protein